MRQLKNFMRNRKAEMLGCGPCVCRTLQCWRYASENCGCGEGVTEEMINSILNWFESTPVYNDLTPEEKEQALADAQEILEGAGDGIAPFYNAVRQGRTFADYVEKMGLDVDESGPCDSSLYEDEEAFIIYISTAGAIHCKYLALVARRGKSPTKELINKEAISDYLDWVTTEMVTYQFKDWDDEILKFGSVKKGETPEAPEDPTREHYIFTGWNPTVGPITKDTTFTATYVGEPCTVSATASTGGTVSPASITVPYGSEIDATVTPTGHAIITIAGQTIEGEPESFEKYEFYDWEGIPQSLKVTGDLTINFVFHKTIFTITFEPRCGGCYEDVGGGTIVPSSLEVHAHSSIEPSGNTLIIDNPTDSSYEHTTVTATADSGYVLAKWADQDGVTIEQTIYVEDDMTIYAFFYEGSNE